MDKNTAVFCPKCGKTFFPMQEDCKCGYKYNPVDFQPKDIKNDDYEEQMRKIRDEQLNGNKYGPNNPYPQSR